MLPFLSLILNITSMGVLKVIYCPYFPQRHQYNSYWIALPIHILLYVHPTHLNYEIGNSQWRQKAKKIFHALAL